MATITVLDVVSVAPELATFATPVPTWTASIAYALGTEVSNGQSVYTCTTAGTSAGTGTGPSGMGTVVDGTVTWAWARLYGVALIEAQVVLAEASVEACLWGERYAQGVALLAAHLVLLSQPQLGGMVAGGGVLQSVTIGSMSKSYASGSSSSTWGQGPHGTTRPGAAYDATLSTLSPVLIYLSGGPNRTC